MSDAIHGVAIFLATRASALGHETDAADAFGRSAFNRYYYATFLTVREFLRQIDADWTRVGHSNIPELMRGEVLSRLKRHAKRQVDQRVLHKSKEKSLISQASQATSAIASLLSSAYSVRVAADYQPLSRVDFEGSGFSLLGHSEAEARNWRRRVEREKGILINISKELGIV